MEIVAFYHLKGGVGKTAAAVNVAYLAAKSGYRTVLWDFDPQAACSWYLQQLASKNSRAGHIVRGKTPLGKLIKKTRYPNLDIIPADFSFRNMDRHLHTMDEPKRLKSLLGALGEDYALVILDCPPSISDLSNAIFRSAHQIAMPLIPTPLSLMSYQKVSDFMRKEGIKGSKLRPFFSMVDKRRKLHKQTIENPPLNLKNLMDVQIPYASAVERMGVLCKPLPEFSPRSQSTKAYKSLWEELRSSAKL